MQGPGGQGGGGAGGGYGGGSPGSNGFTGPTGPAGSTFPPTPGGPGGLGGPGSNGTSAGSLLAALTSSGASATSLGSAPVGNSDPYFLITDAGGGGGPNISGFNGRVVIEPLVVPEPASLGLIALAAGAFFIRRQSLRGHSAA
jgi:hypothetical protein